MLLKFRLLRFLDIFLKPCLLNYSQKEGILRSTSSTSTSALDSRCGSFGIASVLQQLRATSTCYILSFSFIGETSVLEFLPFFLVTVRTTAGQSQRMKDLIRC